MKKNSKALWDLVLKLGMALPKDTLREVYELVDVIREAVDFAENDSSHKGE